MSTLVLALKWAAQLLLFLTGLWAIVGIAPVREDPSSRRRKLTASGWAKVILLVNALALFLVTDFHERSSAQRRAEQAEREQRRCASCS